MEVSFNQYLGRDRVFKMPHIVFPQVKNQTQFVSIETATVYRVETKVSEAMQEIVERNNTCIASLGSI